MPLEKDTSTIENPVSAQPQPALVSPNSKFKIQNSKFFLLLLPAALILGLVVWPNRVLPGRDSGVFLYMGQQILSGRVPYRDVWDHKPPAIFYFDALGLLVGFGAAWGVWLLEFGGLALAEGLGYRLLRQAFGRGPAVLATVAWLCTLGLVIEQGNFTEEFGLPFQFAALYLFWQAEQGQRYRSLGVGLCAGLLFLLKQTLVGIPLAIALYWLISRGSRRQWRELASLLGGLIGGALVPLGLTALYFKLNGGLAALWDQVFRYNFAYTSTDLTTKLQTAWDGLGILSRDGLLLVGLAGWLIGLVWWLKKRLTEVQQPLVGVALLALPLEIALIGLSGRVYWHYLITCLPVMALLVGIAGNFVANSRGPGPEKLRMEGFQLSKVMLGLTAIGLLVVGLAMFSLSNQLAQPDPAIVKYQQTQRAALDYIRQNSAPGDYVLVWGAEASLNFAAPRPSPTRYVYQYALYTPGYQNAAHFQDLLADLTRHPPRLIVDAWAAPGSETIPPLNLADRRQWVADRRPDILPPALNPVLDYLAANYHPAGRVGQLGWIIYQHN